MTGANTARQLTIHFFEKVAIFEFLYFLKFEANLHETSGFVISSMGNPFMDLAFSFNLTFTDIIKCDVVSKKALFK